MSFLKETRGVLTWTIKDLQKSLLIAAAQARAVIAALELQGYIKRSEEGPNEWLTTINGEAVSASKTPRYSREGVEKALALLRERLKQFNRDTQSSWRVEEAVAFGDFLAGRAQAQAADVGIKLILRKGKTVESAVGSAAKREALKTLRARDLKLNLLPYEPWMSGRSHRNLLSE